MAIFAFRTRSFSVVSRLRHPIDPVRQLRPPALDDLAVHDRRHVLGGLQRLVVGQRDQPAVREQRVRGEQQPDVDLTLLDRLAGDRAAGVERDEALEVAGRRSGARPCRHSGRVGHSGGPPNVSRSATRFRSLMVLQPVLRRGLRRDDDGVRVRAGEGSRATMFEPTSVFSSAACDVAMSADGSERPTLRNPERGAGVLGHELHEAAGERRIDELPRSECTRGANVIPSVLQGRGVDVRQQHALREVE